MSMTPFPPIDRTSTTFRPDLDALFLTRIPNFVTEANALQVDVTAKSTATTEAVAAAMAAGLANAGSNAFLSSENRIQTGLDRAATLADRTQTGLDRAAVAAALASIAGGPVASVNGKPGPAPVLTAPDIAPAATPAEMAAGTVTDYRSMSPALVAGAIAARGPAPGDVLITARNPGAGWLNAGTVYLRSAYTALFAQVGLIKDTPVGTVWSSVAGLPLAPNTNPQPITKVVKVSASVFVTFGTEGRIYRSTNAGATWNLVYTAPNARQMYDMVREETTGIIFVCGNVGFFAASTDDGATWNVRGAPSNPNQSQTLIAFSATIVVMGDNAGVIWRSTNAGASWTNVGAPGPSTVSHRYSDTVGSLAGGGLIFITNNAGLNWTVTDIGQGSINIQAILRLSATAFYAATNAGLMKSVVAANNTLTGTDYVRNPNSSVVGAGPVISAFMQFGSDWYLGCSNSSILRTKDNFQTFEVFVSSGPSPSGVSAFFKISENEMWATYGSTLFKSRDFSYDDTTQFKTPSVAGVVGAAAYVKA